MDINQFKRILAAFADEPSDVDVRLGKVVAQIRDDLIDVSIKYSNGPEQSLQVVENDEQYPARVWLLNRVARLPQLADRIIASNNVSVETAARSPFVVPAGSLSSDLSSADNTDLAITDVVETLLGQATNTLPGATSVLYVTSDAGEGKTTVINRAACQQAQRFKAKKVGSLIVPIPLGGRTFLTFDDAVIAALVNKLRFNYLYFDAFIELVRMGAVIPAFDGYEEMLVEGTKNEAVSALGNLVQSLNSSGTVFISARKAFFEYLSFKTQARLLDAIGDRSASFARLGIARWDKGRFCEYGRLRNADDPLSIYETVAARLGADHPLLTRAVLVRRLFDVTSEQGDRAALAELLGTNPHDYFFTFVDAIVKREASEKWLSRVAGDVMEPLLSIHEHHELLSLIAQEMWQSSTTSLRYDVLDVLADIFAESKKKSAIVTRQIKERLKQHSLLTADPSKAVALAFDHEDFQNFYVGESLGRLLAQAVRSDLQAFLSINLLSNATIEQAIQYLLRHKADMRCVADALAHINSSEAGFSFCKENCGVLTLRIAECISEDGGTFTLDSMFFSPDALAGRSLAGLTFRSCHFQPTATANGNYSNIRFQDCEFERLELDVRPRPFESCEFVSCRIDSVVLLPDDEYSFEPLQIDAWLRRAGANILGASTPEDASLETPDQNLKLLERFLRIFLRNTQIDEDVIRIRLGNIAAPRFFDDVLPELIDCKVLEEVTWKGRGMQHRYKLMRPMSDVSEALEQASGSFDQFLSLIRSLNNVEKR